MKYTYWQEANVPENQNQNLGGMDEGVQVFVKLPSGRTLQLDLDPEASLKIVKQKLTQLLLSEDPTKFPLPNQQLLLFKGVQLEDSKSLSDYNIQQDSTLILTIKPSAVDLLGFDCCHYCYSSAIDPRILPCGHSCCLCCIDSAATVCPVLNCKTSFKDLNRDSLPVNCFATLFVDPIGDHTNNCQVCAREGRERLASYWCETCTKLSVPQFYCNECALPEHFNKTTNHLILPVQRINAYSICAQHNHQEDQYCHQETCRRLVCNQCIKEKHHLHQTEAMDGLIARRTAQLKAMISPLKDTSLHQRANMLTTSKKNKQEEIQRLQERIKQLQSEIEQTEKDLHQTNQSKRTQDAIHDGILRSFQALPKRYLGDELKVKLFHSRVDSLLSSSLPPPTPIPNTPLETVLFKESAYEVKREIGGEGSTEGRFNQPFDVALDQKGNLFVADCFNHRVQSFNPKGNFLRAYGTKGSGEGQFLQPISLAFDLEGNLLVLEKGNARVQVIDTSQNPTNTKRTFGSKGSRDGELLNPRGITVDRDSNVLVSDNGNSRILVFSPLGVYLRQFGSRSELYGPVGICVCRSSGNIGLIDSNNNRIRIYSATGKFLRSGSTEERLYLNNPFGIAVDDKETIVISDGSGYKLRVFNSAGKQITTLPQPKTGRCDLKGLIFGPSGSIIVADSGAHRILIYGAK